MTTLNQFFKDHLRLLCWICCVILVVIAGVSIVIDSSHAHSWVEKNIPAFWSFFGFAAAAVIIMISRWFGKAGVQVDDNFDCKCNDTKCNGEQK